MVSIPGNRSLTDEVLSTTMCLVEQTLIARPITPASDDPEGLEALTPNYFILGRANVCILFIPNAEVRSLFKPSQDVSILSSICRHDLAKMGLRISSTEQCQISVKQV